MMAISAVLALLGADDGGLEVLAALFLPMLAALLRAMVGGWQLEELCEGSPRLNRKLTLALAIILLMCLEILVSFLFNAKIRDADAWSVALLLYAAYFLTIRFTLRRPRLGPQEDPYDAYYRSTQNRDD